MVWVTDLVGGGRSNYCADPVTGRKLATIPMSDLSEDSLLAVSSQYLYFRVPVGNGLALRRAPVPAGRWR